LGIRFKNHINNLHPKKKLNADDYGSPPIDEIQQFSFLTEVGADRRN
jgi:hypothetical protein